MLIRCVINHDLFTPSHLQVTMVNCDDAYRAISNPNPCIDGRKANVNLAILGAKPRILPGGMPDYNFKCYILIIYKLL